MRELMEEYGSAILGAIGGLLIIGLTGYAFMNTHGVISSLISRFMSIYL